MFYALLTFSNGVNKFCDNRSLVKLCDSILMENNSIPQGENTSSKKLSYISLTQKLQNTASDM